jgi:DNA repair exonuclease SbcCD ATPase subunit
VWPITSSVYRCPACGTFLRGDETFCAVCGFALLPPESRIVSWAEAHSFDPAPYGPVDHGRAQMPGLSPADGPPVQIERKRPRVESEITGFEPAELENLARRIRGREEKVAAREEEVERRHKEVREMESAFDQRIHNKEVKLQDLLLAEKEATEKAWAAERRLQKTEKELGEKDAELARLEGDRKKSFDDVTSLKSEIKSMEERVRDRETKVKNADRKLVDLSEVTDGLEAEIAKKRAELLEMDREIDKREQILRQTTRALKTVRGELQTLVLAADKVKDEGGVALSTSRGTWEHGNFSFGSCPGCGRPVLKEWAVCPACAQRW